jgi:succinoglycan biosynthesis transport protein ExoP
MAQSPAQMQPMMAPEEDTIDLRAIAVVIWRGKWIIAICTLIAGVFGFLSASQIEPTYRASAKVMFDIQQSNVVNLQEVLVDQAFDSSALESQIEVLRSTTLIERVIDVLRLDANPEFNPSLRIPEPTFGEKVGQYISMPPELIDLAESLNLVSPPAPEPDAVEQARRMRLAVINNVLSGLSLKPVGRSRVIEISYISSSPRTSARIVNAIAEQYIVDQLEAKLEATRAATSWLSTRVDELRLRVQTAEEAVEAARSEISERTGQTLDVTQQQLQALNGALTTIRASLTQQQALYARLSDAVENGRDLGAISQFRGSALIQGYRQQLDELRAQKAVLQASVVASHPALIRVDQQIAEVGENMQTEAHRIISAVEIDLRAAEEQEASLITQVRELEQLVLVQTKNQVELRQLDREAEASRVLYENFLGRLQETSEQEDLQEADARILSPAEQPLYPQGQRKRMILAISLLLGGMVGVGLVILLDRLNNTFRSAGQLEEISHTNVLGVVPSLGSRTKRGEIISHLRDKPASSLAEAVRSLRTSILFSNIDNPPKVVMFTSSVPREGKSTTSMLTALTSRQMGKSAIIVDCDLRLPALSRLVASGGEDRKGLISVLDGSAELEDAIYRDPETGLHVLMTYSSERGGNTLNAADLLSSRKFEEIVRSLAESYDLVILDTPPVLVVTDARIISRLADAVVYAVRWDSTPRGAVLEGLKELNAIEAPLAGTVMTLVNEDKASRYAYDGYSYYKGRYKDYYVT